VTSPLAADIAEAVESFDALDPVAKKLSKAVRDGVPGGPIKDGLSGTWLGHALHPLLTDVPIGAFVSAGLMDLMGEEQAARKLIGVGLAAVPAVVATGWVDYADTEPVSDGVRRTGILHAAVNGVAATLMAGSWVARRNGGGRLLSLAGLGLLGAGGWLGGHLSYAKGVGVDTTAFDGQLEEWTPVDVTEVPDDTPTCARAGTVPVLLVRRGAEIRALHNRCTHRAGSLADGELEGGSIVCPLHGSKFSLEDGSVDRGPAAYPQPVFEVRESGGRIEVRRAS
jgi:nitrite reductase/ring-hydroxylating ferredoxin subunit/uncharacterized membrane protein